MSLATRFALVVKFVPLSVKKLVVSNPEAAAGRQTRAVWFLGRQLRESRPRSRRYGALRAGFHPPSTGRTEGQPPPARERPRSCSFLWCGSAGRRQLRSYSSLCFQPIPLVGFLLLPISLKRFKPTVPVYEEEGPDYTGKKGLKREKRKGATPEPFLLQLRCLQKMIFHPSRETPKKKHHRLVETQCLQHWVCF